MDRNDEGRKPDDQPSGGGGFTGPEQLRPIAEETLGYFEDAVGAAEAELAQDQVIGPNSLANFNSLTGDRAIQSLRSINELGRNNLRAVIEQPAIARVEVADEAGKMRTIFITPGGAPRAAWRETSVASYNSPMGRLAAIPVGDEYTVNTPSGPKSYEVLARARLNPFQAYGDWDSRNTIVERFEAAPLTIVSLRALLEASDSAGAALDLLDSLLEEGRLEANVFEGLRRTVIERMGLRAQPLLDQYQDEIFRLPLDSQVVILGPPGSGKTTTLIKRLGLKLDLQALEDERALVETTIAGVGGHSSSWLMFTPNELLRQYVKEAFARERVPAPDQRIQVWDQFRREVARNRLGILKSSNAPGLILREDLFNLRTETLADQRAFFDDFEATQTAAFWEELSRHAKLISESQNRANAALGARLARIVESGSGPLSPRALLDFRALGAEVSKVVGELQAALEKTLRAALSRELVSDKELLGKLYAFTKTLGEPAADAVDDQDEADGEEEEDEVPVTSLGEGVEAFDAYKRAIRAQARALASGRKVGPRSRNGRILEWLGARAPDETDLRAIGQTVLILGSLRRFANSLRGYLKGIPRRYRQFRRARLADGLWFANTPHAQSDLGPLELDLVLLSMLRGAGALLRDRRIKEVVDEPSFGLLQAVRDLYRTQILVDEATDFSPIQLACMAALCDPATQSFLACGDFNQRITNWGSRTEGDLKWVSPGIDIRTIKVTYRHSRQLNAFAHRVALLSNPAHEKAALPDHVDNEGVDPVLGLGLDGAGLVSWLKDRILEIDQLGDKLPSIAILVNGEEAVQPLATSLQEALSSDNIHCVACPAGQVRGQDDDVRVFDVQHIKGLEFEAVFFVGVDELAEAQPELFDKFIYVGATRAAMYLGLTSSASQIPDEIAPIADAFGENWS